MIITVIISGGVVCIVCVCMCVSICLYCKLFPLCLYFNQAVQYSLLYILIVSACEIVKYKFSIDAMCSYYIYNV